jgi:hypothetical protein
MGENAWISRAGFGFFFTIIALMAARRKLTHLWNIDLNLKEIL